MDRALFEAGKIRNEKSFIETMKNRMVSTSEGETEMLRHKHAGSGAQDGVLTHELMSMHDKFGRRLRHTIY